MLFDFFIPPKNVVIINNEFVNEHFNYVYLFIFRYLNFHLVNMVADYTTVRKQCTTCGKYSNMVMGQPMKCNSCDKDICIYCHRFGYCSTCWNKLSPEQQITAKKEFRAGVRKGSFYVLIVAAIIFIIYAIPIILIEDNIDLEIGIIIVETVLLFFGTLCLLDSYRKKKGKTGLFEQLKIDKQNAPKIDNKQKKIIMIVLLIFALLIIIIIIVASVMMAQFNARWD